MASTTIGDLLVKLRGDTTGFEKSMSRVDARLSKMGKKMTSTGRSITMGLSLPLLGVGVAAGKMSMDLSMTLSRVVGLVGIAKDQVARWREEILALAPQVGKSANELGRALFFVTSAGIRGAAVMETVKAAAQGASAGLGDTAVVADAATSAMNAYAGSNMTAVQATAILVSTIREGKAEAASLAPVLGRVMPIAAELGVSFDQVGASIAAMTRLGFNAEISVTALRATLSQISKVTPAQEKAAEGLGLKFSDLRRIIREDGLLKALMLIKERVGDNETAMTKIFPNIRALSGVLAMVGKNADTTQKIFDSLANTTKEDLAKAIGAAEEQVKFKLTVALIEMQNVLIRIGDDILPLIIPHIVKFGEKMAELAEWFKYAEDGSQKWILVLGGIGIALGPLLIAFGLIAQGVGAILGLAGAVAGLLPSLTAIGSAGATFSAWLVTSAGLAAVATAGFAALAAGIGLLIGNAIRPWVNETLKLNEAFGLVAHKASDISDGMISSKKTWENALHSYNALRTSLKLSGKEWEAATDRTFMNAEALQQLTDKAMKYKEKQAELATAEQKSRDFHAEALAIQLRADGQVSSAMDELLAKEAAHLEALKKKYEVLSKDDIAEQMHSIAQDFHDLKDTVDKTQLAKQFNEPMLKLARLADENKVAIPAPFKEAARHLDDKMIPGLEKLISKVHTFSNDFTNTGKIIDGIFFESGRNIEKSLFGGFKGGVDKGIEHGTVAMDAWVKRLEGQVIYIPVQPDLEGWNEAVQDAIDGRIPDTTG